MFDEDMTSKEFVKTVANEIYKDMLSDYCSWSVMLFCCKKAF